MMNINYYLADPTGNITALVLSRSDMDIKSVAQKIMELHENVEQVGIVDFSDGVRLHMSGDEFCGNAVMSAAALEYSVFGRNGEYVTDVSVYGTDEPVNVKVRKENGYYCCECLLKGPDEIREIVFKTGEKSYRFPLVCFDGIMHIVADETLSEGAARGVIKELADKLNAKALGIMLLSGDKNRLNPLVYVSKTGTLFCENSCASGSCAVAALIGKKGEKIELIQPGGILRVTNSEKICLSGRVSIGECLSKEF